MNFFSACRDNDSETIAEISSFTITLKDKTKAFNRLKVRGMGGSTDIIAK